ncbi:MAG: SDR family NAD(P)-dependent oxidoreductase [Kiritimatiellae bacterium]|nr:SDR family NAD(P)-dependent oxidoreductase [Kiritimatiellia bacterium]
MSAKNEDRLRAYAQHLIDYVHPSALDPRPWTPCLQDMAYTLQVGREAMEERLGMIVTSVDELIEKLKTFLENKHEGDGIFRGQVKRNKDTLAVFTADEELQEAVEKWIQRKKFSKLLDLWVKGLAFDWNRLYEKNHRAHIISLPTYPFAKKRYGRAFGSKHRLAPPSVDQAMEEVPVKELKETYPETIPSCIGNVKKHSLEAVPVEVKKSEKDLKNGQLEHELLIKLLWASLASLGLFKETHFKFSDFKTKTKPLNLDERWFEESLRILIKEGYIQEDDGNTYRVKGPSVDLQLLWNQWGEAKLVWMQNTSEESQITLVEATVRALPDILSGKKHATDVMFPNSSMDLVEGVYKGNLLADYFNDVLGNALVAYVQERLAQDPSARIRLLEIGAGTGGTTAGILLKLRPFQQHIEVYCYTDLSKAFLMHAEENYAPENSYITTQIFDVEKAICEQNIRANYYDLVIATNVLHATKKIRKTVRNAKALLRNKGLILLNEVSDKALYGHLTFALLEGWWLYEDVETRVPGSPALYPQMWKQVLEEEGFRSVYFPAEKTHEFGQQTGSTKNKHPQPHINEEDLNADDAKRNTENNDVTQQASYDYVKATIIEKLAMLLKMETAEIDVEDSFSSYGVDSILGVKFVETISQTLKVEMQTIILFDYNSVNELTKYILSSFEGTISVPYNEKDRVYVKDKDNPFRNARPKPLSSKSDNLGAGIQSVETNKEDIKREPIAIIGMSGRFAKSKNVAEFWEHLAQGHDLVEKASRWDLSSHIDGENAKGFCNYGSFLDDIDKFDPLFFKISGVEATYMDPQQRFFLEECWKALEDAGYAGENIQEKRCGVYVGCVTGDYSRLFSENLPAQALWNNSDSLVPARIAYCLNLKGPAVALDTACSSSLVAIHLACQALWTRETEVALAGGVFVQFTPDFFIMANRAGMLSPSGRCYTFDDRADGFIPGEGVGVVMLKRLDEAISDGDHIYGVIRGSGINQDGNTNGITAPSAKSQERLEREVYERFKIHPETIQMVEAHGTGTSLGDPIEYEALRRAFRHHTQKESYCALGSVKTNIGHAAPAAGIAGVLKVLLSLQNKAIPPSLNYKDGNPAINLDKSPFYVNTRLRDWTVEDNAVRRATISGFGWSGTNAHIVIEEAPEIERRHSEKPGYLIVTSAKTAEQLRCQVENVLSFFKQAEKIDLGNVSYTLLMGRSHLDHRLACVAHNQKELIEWLQKWLKKGKHPSIYVSEFNAKEHREQVSLKRYGNQCIEECQTTDDHVLYLEHLSTLADLYIQGYRLKFDKLFGEGYSRVSMPTYPFAKERYWGAEKENETNGQTNSAIVSNLHPLLHQNTSDFSEQRFSSIFTGTEFFLADHVVQGQKVLPGVAYLEMARVAVEETIGSSEKDQPGVQLRNIVWAQPIAVNDHAKEIHIGLFLEENGQIQYKVYTTHPSDGKSAIHNPESAINSIVHSQGVALFGSVDQSPKLNLKALQEACNQNVLGVKKCYKVFKTMGVEYGPSHQGIENVYIGEGQVLARLSLPACVVGTEDQFVLHPSLLDSALQASIGLAYANREPGTLNPEPLLPFALKELQIYRPCTSSMWALIRYANESAPESKMQKLDMDLCDDQGNVCVRMKEFSFRVLAGELELGSRQEAVSSEKSIEPAVGLTMISSVWNPISMPEQKSFFPAQTEQVLIVGGTKKQKNAIQEVYLDAQPLEIDAEEDVEQIASRLSALDPIDHIVWIAPDRPLNALTEESLIKDQSQGVYQVFRLVKALLVSDYGAKELGWTVITSQTQAVCKKDVVNPVHAGIHGIMGSLAKEYPNWKIRLLDVETDADWPVQEMFMLPVDAQGDALAYRGNEWFHQALVPVREFSVDQHPYRSQGVYVVIGGAGGISEVWSRYMIENYQAQIIWIGRRKKKKTIQAKLDALAKIGRAPTYIQADVTKLESLQKAYEEIKQTHSQIHGVIHAAIVLLDKSLTNMDEERFHAGFSAKVDVSVRLAQVFQKEALDFVLFFSSIQSFTKSPGQSNYASGCTFKDAFAHQLANEWSCAVKVINWGYWGSVGIVTDPAYQSRMEKAGIGSIEPEDGMDALVNLIQGPLDQFVLIKTLRPGAMGDLLTKEWVSLYPEAISSYIGSLDKQFTKQGIATHQSAAGELHMGVMKDLLPKLLCGSLQCMSVLKEKKFKRSDFRAKTKLLSLYDRWLEESLQVLRRKGYLHDDGSFASFFDLKELWKQWDEAKLPLMEDVSQKAQVVLLEACLRALPDILVGKKLATDVMFSNSSMELVGEVYKGNVVADYYNEVLCHTVLVYLQKRFADDPSTPVKILEIGAGTGGTTAGLLPQLRPFQDQIQEYCYTDLSKAFLIHAEEQYAPGNPYLTTHIFDVSKPLSGQGIQGDHYDLVIATNVLHATRNIRQTLRNAKAALRKHGLLLMNELSMSTLFNHLTFGLLEGWWLYDDEALRIPGCPGLTPETWANVLEEEGFHSTFFPAQKAHKWGQQVIVTESDGLIRQQQALASTRKRKAPQISKVSSESIATVEIPTKGKVPTSLREKSVAYLKKLVASSIKISSHQLDPSKPLEEYGLDSILVVQLTNTLGKVFEDISSTLFFEVQTLDALVDHLIETQKDILIQQVGGGANEVEEQIALSDAPPAFKSISIKSRRFTSLPASKIKPSTLPQLAIKPSASQTFNVQDVAIIGLSGRYPQAKDVNEFWKHLKSGKNCITEIPQDRWDWKRYFNEEKGKQGSYYTRWGGFLEDIDKFDPLFFRLSPREAERMDPQARLFLEEAYASIEDAGYTGATLCESRKVGVFVGVMNSTYASHPGYWSIANRISYLMNFQGPSIAVDTACSASLTAIHLALESLYSGMSECAIAGGVNLILHPVHYVALSEMTMLSSGDQCKTFGDQADGFVDAEGVGAIVLKPLPKAVADQDHIYGIIKGSMLNAGGKTNGYTVPNPNAQCSLIAGALERAGVHPRTLSYIEAHGTGTVLGDPIEISGLTRAFENVSKDTSFEGEGVSDKQYCAIGSIKSNMGHAESAAGIAGLTKVVLQMKYGQLVPSLHSEVLNPNINFEKTPFVVQQKLEDWKCPIFRFNGETKEYPRIAGVSSFGAGGANAHVIIEEHLDESKVQGLRSKGPVDRLALIVLSAKNEDRLRAYAQNLIDYLHPSTLDLRPLTPRLEDVAYTLQVGREAMEERLGLIVGSAEELVENLKGFLEDRDDVEDLYRGQVKRSDDALAVFTADEDLQKAIDAWVCKGKYSKLLDLWVKGMLFDWSKLHGEEKPRRISLPTYPFARERYWIEQTEVGSQKSLKLQSEKQNLSRIDSNSEKQWLFIKEDWLPESIPDDVDWNGRLKEYAGKMIYVLSADEKDQKGLCSLLKQLEESANLSEPFKIQILNPHKMDEHSFKQTPDVVFFLGPKRREDQEDPSAESNVSDVFRLSQYLMKSAWNEPIKIYYIYEGTPSHPHLNSEALSGFLKSAMMENNQHVWRCIGMYDKDIPAARHERLLKEWLFDQMEIKSPVPFFEARYEGSDRLVPQLVETNLEPSLPATFRPDGTYIITGGLGPVGELVCEELAKQRQSTLVILSRGGWDKTKQTTCQKLESLGSKVIYHSVDITDQAALQKVYTKIKKEVGPIHGVIHLARLVEDELIVSKPWESFERVIQAKVQGTRYLDELTADEPLDFFMLFSSMAAFGIRGSSDYGYSATFQNVFARWRNQLRTKGTRSGFTIAQCWGAWTVDTYSPKNRDKNIKSAGLDFIGIESAFPFIEACCAYDLGGTNAHVVMSNHIDKQQCKTLEEDIDAFPIILSAKTKEILMAYVQDIYIHLNVPSHQTRYRSLCSGDKQLLKALSLTLIGRERYLDCRTIFLANSYISLLECCKDFLSGKKNKHIISKDDVFAPEKTNELLESYLEKRIVRDLSVCWVHGMDIPWIRLYHDSTYPKLPLPPVPFIGKIHQLKQKTERTSLAQRSASLPPIEERMVVVQEGELTCVECTIYHGDYFMNQHVVEGLPIMPGVGYLALLTHIAQRVFKRDTFTVKNVAWVMPFDLSHESSTMLFEFTGSGHFRLLQKEQKKLCCKGQLQLDQQLKTVDLSSQIDRLAIEGLRPIIEKEAYWNLAGSSGSKQRHGSDFQRLSEIYRVDQTMLGVLEPNLSSLPLPEIPFYDSSLGVCNGFAIEKASESSPAVPFAMDQFHFLHPIAPEKKVYAMARERTGKLPRYDISIEDGEGTIYALFNGYFCKSFQNLPTTSSSLAAKTKEKPQEPINARNNQPESVSQNEAHASGTPDHPESADIETGDIKELFTAELQKNIADFLKVDVEEVPLDESLEPLGLDSIAVNELTDQMSHRMKMDIPPTTMFEYTNIEDIVEFLVDEFEEEICAYMQLKPSSGSPSQSTHEVAPALPTVTVNVKAGDSHGAASGGSTPYLENRGISPFPSSTPHTLSSNSSDIDTGVAIVGIGGLFPGANNVREFWDKIRAGDDLITELPEPRRTSIYRVYDQEIKHLKGLYAGFIEDADKFDAAFFNLSEEEMMAMDPQQRLFLEATWHAIEDAGYYPLSFSGRKVGVYVGAVGSEYSYFLTDAKSAVSLAYVGTGNALSSIANRTSYFFDLNGPSQAIETACCSSLYAIDQAVKDLQYGVCEAAIAGGVNFICHANAFYMYQSMDYLAKDWRCKAFADGGDGWSKGELFAAIFLKKYDQAVKDKDHIYGVIKSSGTNHGGKSYFYVQPNSPKHVELITEVYKRAEVDPRQVVHVEAHGTGTEMGDALEFNVIAKALKQLAKEQGITLPTNYCGLGSIKSNIGHTEAGSGIAGLIKSVMLLYDKTIPPTLHIEKVNKNIRLEKSPLFLVNKQHPFPILENQEKNQVRYASVHSFNFSGSTAHALLEEHIPRDEEDTPLKISHYPICLSAKSPKSLYAYCEVFIHFLESNSKLANQLERIVYTTNSSKSFLEYRLSIKISSFDDLIERLKAILKDFDTDSIHGIADVKYGRTKKRSSSKIQYPPLEDQTIDSLVELWITQEEFDWSVVLKPFSIQKISLPLYSFEHDISYFPQVNASVIKKEISADEEGPTVEVDLQNSQSAEEEKVEKNDPKIPVDSSSIKDEMQNMIAAILSVSPTEIDVNNSVSEYSFNSMTIAALSDSVNERFSVDTKPPDFFEFSTINEIIHCIEEMTQEKDRQANDFGRSAIQADPQQQSFSEALYGKFLNNEINASELLNELE